MKKEPHRRSKKRRFVFDRQRGRIVLQYGGQSDVSPAQISALSTGLTSMLHETGRIVTPAIKSWRLPPVEAVILVMQAVYFLLADEQEDESDEETVSSLCQVFLYLWEQGTLHMDPAFPYTFRQFDAAVKAGELSKKSGKLIQSPLWLDLGKRALRERSYLLAEACFSQAIDYDISWETDASFWYGLACLHRDQVDEALQAWEADSLERSEAGAIDSYLGAQWYQMGQAPSIQAYLEEFSESYLIADEDDPLDVFAVMGEDAKDPQLVLLYHAIENYLRGNYQSCLEKCSAAHAQEGQEYLWMIFFWEAMASSALHHIDQAKQSLQQAVERGIPAHLLLPARWLRATHQKEFTDVFLPSLERNFFEEEYDESYASGEGEPFPGKSESAPSSLMQRYAQITLLQNQKSLEQAVSDQDDEGQFSLLQARVSRQALLDRIHIIEVAPAVIDFLEEQQASQAQHSLSLLYVQRPTLPGFPLLVDFGERQIAFPQGRKALPALVGFSFTNPTALDIVREIGMQLPEHFRILHQRALEYEIYPSVWGLSGLDVHGEEFLHISYRPQEESRPWQIAVGHSCPFGTCVYGSSGELVRACVDCEITCAHMVNLFSILLHCVSGAVAEVTVREAQEERMYFSDPTGRTSSERQKTRLVSIHYLECRLPGEGAQQV